LGLNVECFDYDTQHPNELMTYDVVEMIGGNPYYLLNSIKIHGFEDVLKTFAEDRILIGCSAGVLVITPNLNLINIYSPEMNIVGLRDLSALCLTDVQILPHYTKFLKRYNSFEEKCFQYEKDNNCNVIRINDGEGVIVDKDNHYIIRI
jgi:dipeptidase E